jgi:uncharacterized repeat protein (TIGR01451 family)
MSSKNSFANKLKIFVFTALFLSSIIFPYTKAHASVSNYAINYAVQSAPGEITVNIQINYCTGCNPNTGNDSNGRYALLVLKDSVTGNEIARQQLTCNQNNWPLGQLIRKDFVFTGLNLAAGSEIIVEGDYYCDWCSHWNPPPLKLKIEKSNTSTTYTGELAGKPNSSVNLSAVLVDKENMPLVGKTIQFTLDSLAPVAAITDTSGIATATISIPNTITPGTYKLQTRFIGDQDNQPSSDIDDFTVSIKSRKLFPKPNLSIKNSDGDKNASTGDLIEYQLTVENNGNCIIWFVNIYETLPNGTSFVADKNPGWKIENGKFVYNAGPINLGEKKEFKFIVKVNDTLEKGQDKIINTAEVKGEAI